LLDCMSLGTCATCLCAPPYQRAPKALLVLKDGRKDGPLLIFHDQHI
jgi:hypothetical protein